MKTLKTIMMTLVLGCGFSSLATETCQPLDEAIKAAILAQTGGKSIEALTSLRLAKSIDPKQACNFPELQSLAFDSPEALRPIADFAVELPKLTTLDIFKPGFTSLCEGGSCPLAQLRISKLTIMGGSIHAVPSGSLPLSLTNLIFAFTNNPKTPGAVPFGDVTGFGELTELNLLDVDSNYLQDLSFLRNLKNLTELHLYQNKLNNSHLADLIHSPSAMNLSQVYLDDNDIEDVSVLAAIAPRAWDHQDGFRISGNPLKTCPMTTASEDFNIACLYFNDRPEKESELSSFFSVVKKTSRVCEVLWFPVARPTLDFFFNQCRDDIAPRIDSALANLRSQDPRLVELSQVLLEYTKLIAYDLNQQDGDGKTRLTRAALQLNRKAITWLLAAGADKLATERSGKAPYQVASTASEDILVQLRICKSENGAVMCDSEPFEKLKEEIVELLSP